MTEMPRAEDFGLTPADVERMPAPWVEEHRGGLVAGLVAAVLGAAFGLAWNVSGSLSAASFFAVVAVAASLVVLLPAAVLLVCALGCAEDRIRSRRSPLWRACSAYRRAVGSSRGTPGAGEGSAGPARGAIPWRRLDHPDLVAAARSGFLAEGWEVAALQDARRAGADLVMHRGDGLRAAVRCQAGPLPATLDRARELAAVRADLGVDELILVCPGGVEGDALAYAACHGLRVVEVPGAGG